MPLDSLPDDVRSRLRREADVFLMERSGPGALAATVGSIAFTLFVMGAPSFSRTSRWFTATAIVVYAARFVVLYFMPKLDASEAAHSRWRVLRATHLITMSVVFAGHATFAFATLGIGSATFVLLLILNALSFGMAATMAPMRRTTIASQIILLGAPALAMAQLPGRDGRMYAALVLVSLLYTLVTRRRIEAQYWTSVVAVERLRQKSETIARLQHETRALVENTPDAMAIERSGELLFVNDAWARLIGRPRTAFVGTRIVDLCPPAQADAVRDFLARGEVGSSIETAIVCGDNERVATWELRVGEWFELDGVHCRPIIGRDVSDQKMLRAKLALSEHLASLGNLAAGVGHEINNPLTYILGNLDEVREHLRERTGDDDELLEMVGLLDEAHEGAERVRTIVRDLNMLSRHGGRELAPINLYDSLAVAIRITAKQLTKRARLIRTIQPDLPKVLGNSTKLAQVFTNLLINATHAIPEGAPEKNLVAIIARSSGGTVVVEVGDTGSGIPPEHLPRIFDPFFTTKQVGVGTGIGLSIVHATMQSFGGDISVRSEPGKGATFTLVLRVANQAIEHAA